MYHINNKTLTEHDKDKNNEKPMRPPLPRTNSFGSTSASSSAIKINDGSNDGSNHSNDGLYDFVSTSTSMTSHNMSPVTASAMSSSTTSSSSSSSNSSHQSSKLTQDKLDHHQQKMSKSLSKQKKKHKSNKKDNKKMAIRGPLTVPNKAQRDRDRDRENNKFEQLFSYGNKDGAEISEECAKCNSSDHEDATSTSEPFVHVEYDDVFGKDINDSMSSNNIEPQKKQKNKKNNNNSKKGKDKEHQNNNNKSKKKKDKKDRDNHNKNKSKNKNKTKDKHYENKSNKNKSKTKKKHNNNNNNALSIDITKIENDDNTSSLPKVNQIKLKSKQKLKMDMKTKSSSDIPSKFHEVFAKHKQQQEKLLHPQPIDGVIIDHTESDDDQKLDPEAPAYIPGSQISPWLVNGYYDNNNNNINSNNPISPPININIGANQNIFSLSMQQAMNGLFQLLPYQTSNTSIATTPITKLQPVPENDDVDNNSNASSSNTNSTNSQPSNTTQTQTQATNNNGYITTNIVQPNQLLHTPKDFNSGNNNNQPPQSPITPQQIHLLQSLQRSNSLPTQFPLPPSLQEIQQHTAEGIQRTSSMPDLLANPPPHPSQLLSRSFGQLPTPTLPTPFVGNFKPPQNIYNGLTIPLLPNILDINQNQIALQLQSAVNQNIINANNLSLLQQAQTQNNQNQNGNHNQQSQTPPVVTPPPNNQNGQNSNSSQSDQATNVSGEQTQQTQNQTPTQQIVIGPQQQQQITTTINGHQPTISATPTLINVADGVIPGVEAGLYWYHPQIDQSAVLLPVVVNDAQQQQPQMPLYPNPALQQIAIQNQLI